MAFSRSAAVVLALCLVFICGAQYTAYGAPSDPCSLLTQAQVSAALGAGVDAGTSSLGRICRWATPNGQPGRSPAVVVTMQDAKAFAFAKAPTKSASLVKTPGGVGDDAVFNTIGGVTATLTVKKGDAYFEVHVYGFGVQQTQTIEKTLAQEIVGTLK